MDLVLLGNQENMTGDTFTIVDCDLFSVFAELLYIVHTPLAKLVKGISMNKILNCHHVCFKLEDK